MPEDAKDWKPGMLDALLDEGEADFAHGNVHDGESVFAELDAMSKSRRSEQAK